MFYIKLYNSFNTKHGLNLREGGNNSRLSEQHKKRISDSLRGMKRIFTQEHKDKLSQSAKHRIRTSVHSLNISIAKKGRSGHAHSEFTKQKISDALTGLSKGVGRKHSDETKDRISKSQIGKSKKHKGRPWSIKRRLAQDSREV